MKILQINTTVNTGSTGKITEAIGIRLQEAGHKSYIAYGRNERPSRNELIKIGTDKDIYQHGLKTLITDRHGFGSRNATLELIEKINKIQPDIIGIHNLHGYYINIEVLFSYIKTANIPVLWTLFDCWAFTGHCTYYDNVACRKWETGCHSCPKTKAYPSSYVLDNSKRNYDDKKKLFHLPQNMHLVVHSAWLQKQVQRSFLKDLPIHHIFNGANLEVFKVKKDVYKTSFTILGVANTWDERKGLKDFKKLRSILSNSYSIVLIGLNKEQLKNIPEGIEGISRTEDVEELVDFYNNADVFINPTYQDNFPTTNIEALACGTPVITYDTGGSPEAIDQQTGKVVKKGDINGLKTAVEELMSRDQQKIQAYCRSRAVKYFNQHERYSDYLYLFESLLEKTHA